MHGTMKEGFARVDGALALLVHRSDQTDRALGEHRDALTAVESRVDTLEAVAKAAADHGPRISSVERLVWIGVGMATLGGTAGGWAISLLTN
ncbi:hypothetical protein ACFUJR_27675 [Streptomyces sp. NPDC057271]|uniref:hypothetical protein n=1 Tax=unclassified Streptomyces TaxID=2593676 RepID=UPI0036342CD9